MTITDAQRALSDANAGGGPGVLVSGIAWLVAAAVLAAAGPRAAYLALFVGGMAIVPVSALIARAAFAATPSPGNPLNRLGFEVTVTLFAGLVIAWALLPLDPARAFGALAVAVGARYFAFRTLYADPLFWALGAALFAAGTLALLGWPVPILPVVGAIECAFAIVLLVRRARR